MLGKFRSVRPLLVILAQSGRRLYSYVSPIRLNFHQEVEDAISHQINEELTASYIYFSIATVFGRDDVALPGFRKLFTEFADEEIGHAKSWANYLNLRGGKAKFSSIKGITDADWTPLCATSKAIDMEMKITQEIMKLRALADKHRDLHFAKFIEDEYLMEQYEGLKKLSDLKTQIERVGDKEGLYILDKDILKNSSPNPKIMPK